MSRNKERRENAARLYRNLAARGPQHDWIADVDGLQRISRALGRIGERQCNEDTACQVCLGQGEVVPAANNGAPMRVCRRCGGTGDRLGKRESRLLASARVISARYGLRVYHQTDPRGWALYLIPTTFPQREDESHYNSRGMGVSS